MTNSPTTLVTGAAGTVGRHVALGLAERGANVIATTHPPDAAAGDLRRFRRHREGLPRPSTRHRLDLEVHFPAFDAAERRGVEHVVFLSRLGAAQSPFVPASSTPAT